MRISIKHKFFDSILLLLLIFSSGGLLFVFHRNIMSLVLFFLSLSLLIFTGKQIKKNIFNNHFFIFLFLLLLFGINYFFSVGSQSIIKYAFHLLNIVSCIFVLIHFSNNRDLRYFQKRIRFVLKIILYFSLVNFFSYIFLKNFLTTLYPFPDRTLQTFYNLFFYDTERSSLSFLGIDFVRNQGWFWEPGINQIYLNILLYLEGFVFKQNKKVIILIILAILTTYSTTGVLIMLILLFFMFQKLIKTSPILMLLAFSTLIPFYYIAKNNVEEKIETFSFQKRYFDLIQTISIAKDYPITGIGLDDTYFSEFRTDYFIDNNFRESFEESTNLELIAKSTDKGSSNSVTFLMAAMGIPIAFLLLLCLFKQQLFSHRKGIFMIIVMMSVISEPLLLRPFFLLLIISGLGTLIKRFIK